MDAPATLIGPTAQDAADALVTLGWPVKPHGQDFGSWSLGDFVLNDDELMSLAKRQGVLSAAEQLQ